MFSGFSIFVQLIVLKMSQTEIQPTQNIKNNPKIMKAWAVYDWANSVYSLVITSTIFPIYYSIITTAYEKKEFVQETGRWIDVPVRHMITICGFTVSISIIISRHYWKQKILLTVFLLFGSHFMYGIGDVYRNA